MIYFSTLLRGGYQILADSKDNLIEGLSSLDEACLITSDQHDEYLGYIENNIGRVTDNRGQLVFEFTVIGNLPSFEDSGIAFVQLPSGSYYFVKD